MWRSEFLNELLYKGKGKNYSFDLEQSELDFIRNIQHFFRDLEIQFTMAKHGDPKSHLIERFKLMHKSYHKLKEKGSSMGLEDLGKYVDFFSDILNFGIYKIPRASNTIMDMLKVCQTQIDALIKRVLYYDEEEVDNEMNVSGTDDVPKKNDHKERKKARTRQREASLQEIKEDLDDVRKDNVASKLYLETTHRNYDETNLQLSKLEEEIDQIDKRQKTLKTNQDEIRRKNLLLKRELSMWQFTVNRLTDEEEFLENRIKDLGLK